MWLVFMWGGTKRFFISRELWRLEISAVEEQRPFWELGVGAGVGIGRRGRPGGVRRGGTSGAARPPRLWVGRVYKFSTNWATVARLKRHRKSIEKIDRAR